MDFVVLGFGIGALWVLIGLVVRDHGPRLRRLRSDRDRPWGDIAVRVTWRRTCRASGLALATAGGFVGAVTLAALVGRASDQAGLMIVLSAIGAAVGGVLAWSVRYRQVTTGFGLRRQRAPRPVEPAPSESAAEPPVPESVAVASPFPLDETAPSLETVEEGTVESVDASAAEAEGEQLDHLDVPAPSEEAGEPASVQHADAPVTDAASDDHDQTEPVDEPAIEAEADDAPVEVADDASEPLPMRATEEAAALPTEEEVDDSAPDPESSDDGVAPTAARLSSRVR